MSRRHKCFVPNCHNSVSKTQEKLFISVNNIVKRKWCKQLNIAYDPQQRLYCCEDHLDLNNDLDNYYQWKFMNASPRLKPTAMLRHNTLENQPSNTAIAESKNDGVQIGTRNQLSNELCKILPQSIEYEPSIASEDILDGDAVSSALSAEPAQIDVATQCDTTIMKDKSTFIKRRIVVTKPVIKMYTKSTQTESANPSGSGSTFEKGVSDGDLNNVATQCDATIMKDKSTFVKSHILVTRIPKKMNNKSTQTERATPSLSGSTFEKGVIDGDLNTNNSEEFNSGNEIPPKTFSCKMLPRRDHMARTVKKLSDLM